MTPSQPVPAATVILARDGPDAGGGLEIFLLKRHRKSSFMSNAFVFPGGKVDPEDGDSRTAAIRELFEEAGVLLARGGDPEALAAERVRLNAGQTTFGAILAGAGLSPEPGGLHFWARWVTPSAEPRRYDTDFFVAALPEGQVPSFDQKETVEELWIGPAEALERQAAGTLRLAPPQLRTFYELAGVRTVAEAFERARARTGDARVPICPKLQQTGDGFSILLPWDPEYDAGVGEGEPIATNHPLASPPSRFVWNGSTWAPM